MAHHNGIMKIILPKQANFPPEKVEAEKARIPRQDCNWAGDVKIPPVISLALQARKEKQKITIPITTHHFYMAWNYGKQDKRN